VVFWRVSHAMSLAWPHLTLSIASLCKQALVLAVFANGWDPQLTVASR